MSPPYWHSRTFAAPRPYSHNCFSSFFSLAKLSKLWTQSLTLNQLFVRLPPMLPPSCPFVSTRPSKQNAQSTPVRLDATVKTKRAVANDFYVKSHTFAQNSLLYKTSCFNLVGFFKIKLFVHVVFCSSSRRAPPCNVALHARRDLNSKMICPQPISD